MKRPDRALFEKEIAYINEQLNALDAEYKSLVGGIHAGPGTGDSSDGLIGRYHEDRNQLKSERDSIRNEIRSTNVRLDECQKKIKLCKADMSKLESDDLYYKDETKLASYLKRLEHQYNSMQTRNVREEKALVTQIDRAKRNQKQLIRWRKLMAEKDEMIKHLNDLKIKREALYRRSNDLKSAELLSRNKERDCKSRAHMIKSDLENLYKTKRSLIVGYEQECKQYTDYCKSNNKTFRDNREGCSVSHLSSAKQRVQRTASGKKHVKKSCSNEECHSDDSETYDYEPFSVEKRLCNNLMAYVRTFLIDHPVSTESDGQKDQKVEPPNVSDEETENKSEASMNDAFDQISKGNEKCSAMPTTPKVLRKKCASRKDKRRLTQPIPHAPNVFSDFERLGLKAPVNYAELNVVLEKLENKLKFYEDQTLLPLNFSFNNACDVSYATSESELTVDTDSYQLSALSLSEDSFTSRHLSQNSLGFASKNRSSIDSELGGAQSPFSIDKKFASLYDSSPVVIEPTERKSIITADRELSQEFLPKLAKFRGSIDDKQLVRIISNAKRSASLADFSYSLNDASSFDRLKQRRWSRSCDSYFVYTDNTEEFSKNIKDEGFCSKGSTS